MSEVEERERRSRQGETRHGPSAEKKKKKSSGRKRAFSPISIMEIALVPASSSREKYPEYTPSRRTMKSSQFGRQLNIDDES